MTIKSTHSCCITIRQILSVHAWDAWRLWWRHSTSLYSWKRENNYKRGCSSTLKWFWEVTESSRDPLVIDNYDANCLIDLQNDKWVHANWWHDVCHWHRSFNWSTWWIEWEKVISALWLFSLNSQWFLWFSNHKLQAKKRDLTQLITMEALNNLSCEQENR